MHLTSKNHLGKMHAAHLNEAVLANLTSSLPSPIPATSQQVTPHQTKEELLLLVEEMSRNKQELEAKRYVDASLSRFTSLMRWRVELSLEQWADALLMELVPFLQGLQAALYLVDEAAENAKKNLRLIGRYACPENVPLELAMGQGLTGQVALAGKPLYYPEAGTFTSHTSSCLSQVAAQALLIQPLLHNSNVEGVLELSTTKAFSTQELELIRQLADALAANLSTIRNQVRVQLLYREAQDKAAMLAAQEEEMRQNMEELEATQEEMKRVQREIVSQQAEFTRMTDTVPGMIYQVHDKGDGGKLGYVSNGCEQIFGVPASQVDYEFLRNMIYPADKPGYLARVQQHTQGGTDFEWIGRTVLANGQLKWIQINRKAERQQDGSLLWTGIITDVSRQKQVEEELHHINAEMLAQQEELRQNLDQLEVAQREIKASHVLIDCFLNSNTDRLMAVDTNLKIFFCNKLTKKFLHLAEDADVRGLEFVSLLPPNIQASSEANLRRALAGESFTDQVHLKTEAGKDLYREVTYFPLKNEEGRVVGAANTSHDITARTETHLKLQASEAKFHQMTANLPGIVYQYKLEKASGLHGFVYASARIKDVLGLDPSEVVGKLSDAPNTAFHPDDAEEFKEAFSRSATQLSYFHWTGRMLDATTGKYSRYMEFMSTPRMEEDAIYWDGYMWDVTDRILAERRNLQLLSVLQYTEECLLMCDMQGQLLYLNDACKRLAGDKLSVGMPLYALIPPDEQAHHLEVERAVLLKEGSWHGTGTLLDGDGRRIPVRKTLIMHKNLHGEPESITMLAQLVTTEKTLNTRLAQLEA